MAVTAASSLVSTLQDLNQAFAGKSLAAQKRQFKINKALGIAETVINTYRAAQNAETVQPYPVGVALAALAVVSGLAKVATISKQTFQGEGGGGGTSAGISGSGNSTTRAATTGFTSIAPPTTASSPQSQVKTEPMKVYVLEKDIKKATNSADAREAKAIVK